MERVIKVLPGAQLSKDKKVKVNWDNVTELAKEKGISFYKLSQMCRQSVSYLPKAKERNAMIPQRVYETLEKILGENIK